MLVLLATTLLDIHPFELVRVEDPNHPDAIARSATGSVIIGEPDDDTEWHVESVPHTDDFPANEAIEAMNVGYWHLEGHTGEGVKVAVFDLHWSGETMADELGWASTHDCWEHASCEVPMEPFFPKFGWEEGVHGVACAEVIHDIAPDAELYLVRVNGRTTLENAVEWAIREDIDLISMSMSFFNSSFYDGTGPFSDLMGQLAANGVLMVTSSGNYAEQNYIGEWRDQDFDGRMDFGGDNGLWLSLRQGKSRGVYVNWNEHAVCGVSDLDAALYDQKGNLIGRSSTKQSRDRNACQPIERLTGWVESNGFYWLEVTSERVNDAGLDVSIIATSGEIIGGDARTSIVDPGVSPFVFTVGAVRASGYLKNKLEAFSSRGPTIAGVFKPDVVGPDGLTTDSYGTRGFFGTSASTPAVTGALALVMSREPELTPFDAADRVRAWALSDEPLFSEPDPRFGAGRVRLPVITDDLAPCGRRPLILFLLLGPLLLWRRVSASRALCRGRP